MKKSVIFSRLMLAAFVLLSTAACSIRGTAQTPQKEIFVLRADPPGNVVSAAMKPSGCSLRIGTPVPAVGLNTARMAYSTEPKRLEYFAYHEWAAPPAKMLESLIERQLDASGMFRFVVTNLPDIRADLRLDSNLQTLQQNFDNGSSGVQLVVKVTLAEPETRTLVASETFGYEEIAAGADAESGVDAANRAAGQFLIDLQRFIGKSMDKTNCSNRD